MERPVTPAPMPQPPEMPQPPMMPEMPQMPEQMMPCMPCMPMHELPCDPRMLRHMYHHLKICHKYELEMLKWYMRYCSSQDGDCRRPYRNPNNPRRYRDYESPYQSPWRRRWESPSDC